MENLHVCIYSYITLQNAVLVHWFLNSTCQLNIESQYSRDLNSLPWSSSISCNLECSFSRSYFLHLFLLLIPWWCLCFAPGSDKPPFPTVTAPHRCLITGEAEKSASSLVSRWMRGATLSSEGGDLKEVTLNLTCDVWVRMGLALSQRIFLFLSKLGHFCTCSIFLLW